MIREPRWVSCWPAQTKLKCNWQKRLWTLSGYLDPVDDHESALQVWWPIKGMTASRCVVVFVDAASGLAFQNARENVHGPAGNRMSLTTAIDGRSSGPSPGWDTFAGWWYGKSTSLASIVDFSYWRAHSSS